MKRTRIIIVNKRRFFTCICALAAILASAICALTAKHASTVFAQTQAEPTIISVSAGDTLWSIASEYADGADVRALIDDIMDANELSSPNICVGDTLVIPK